MRVVILILLLVCFYYLVMIFKDFYIDYKKAKACTLKVDAKLMASKLVRKCGPNGEALIFYAASFIYENNYHEAVFYDKVPYEIRRLRTPDVEMYVDPNTLNGGYFNKKKAMKIDMLLMLLMIFILLIFALIFTYIICTFL